MRAFGLKKLVGFYLSMLGVAALALWARGGELHVLPALTWRAWGSSLGLGVGAGLVLVVASRLLVAHVGWAERLAEEFRSLIGELSWREAGVMAALSSLGEEALFRGVLQPSLGLVIGSLVFGLLHIGPNRRFWPWTLMACVAGFVFGGLFAWSGNLVASVLAHATVNFLNLRHLGSTEQRLEVHLEPVGGESAVGS